MNVLYRTRAERKRAARMRRAMRVQESRLRGRHDLLSILATLKHADHSRWLARRPPRAIRSGWQLLICRAVA